MLFFANTTSEGRSLGHNSHQWPIKAAFKRPLAIAFELNVSFLSPVEVLHLNNPIRPVWVACVPVEPISSSSCASGWSSLTYTYLIHTMHVSTLSAQPRPQNSWRAFHGAIRCVPLLQLLAIVNKFNFTQTTLDFKSSIDRSSDE